MNNLFDRSSRAFTYMGIFAFILSIPLYWITIKVGIGTLLYLPTMATDFQDASVGVPLLFIGGIICLLVVLGVWGFFGKKAGIVVGIILSLFYWRLLILILFLLLFVLLPFIAIGLVILIIVLIKKYISKKFGSTMPKL